MSTCSSWSDAGAPGSIIVREGVLLTILQQTPQEARAEVTGSRGDLNVALGGWRSLRPLYDPTGILRDLMKRAKHPTEMQFREAARRALIETYEDLGKVRNAVDVGDEEEARAMAIWYSGAPAGALLDLHHHVLRTGRRWFIEIRRYGAVGESIRRLRHESLSLAETRRVTEASWADLLALASRKRFRLPKFAGPQGSL